MGVAAGQQQLAMGSADGTFGRLPHQIRGFLSTFASVQPVAYAFEHCTACNPSVCAEFKRNGFGFVRKACADAAELGRVSGLEAFQAECDALALGFEEDEFEDDGDDF